MYLGRLVTISFFDTVDASSKKTLVSQRINVPFRTTRIRASFAPGVNRLMKLYFYISPDPSAPSTEAPTGYNVLAQTGQATYISGDNDVKDFQMEIMETVRGQYLKVYAVNEDTYPHTIDVQITVEFAYLEERAKPKR